MSLRIPLQRSRVRCLKKLLWVNPGDISVHKASPYDRGQEYATSTEQLPRVAQPSIWHSIIPKAFREPRAISASSKSKRTTEWNPATFFICIFLLIGSNAIQMLTLRNEFSTFNRKADRKIALLKEVLEKVQRGEKVDVEKVLGTGDEVQEQEWKDGWTLVDAVRLVLLANTSVAVINNIEEEDHLWAAKDRRREKRRLKKEQAAAAKESSTTDDQDDKTGGPENTSTSSDQAKKPPNFY